MSWVRVAASRSNLGLGSAATRNSGDAAGNVPVLNAYAQLNADKIPTGTDSGDIAVLGTGGRFDVARLGSGTADATKRLDGSGAWVDAGPTFSTAVNLDIDASNASFYATGFTGWNDKTVVVVSLGQTAAADESRIPGFVIFVADLLAIPATASAGDATDTTGTNRNSIRYLVQDPADNDGRNEYWFGRTSSGELLWATARTSDDAYPFRAIAL